jgi:hypothetical protein
MCLRRDLRHKTLAEPARSVWGDVIGRARLTCNGMDTQVSTGYNTESGGSTARGGRVEDDGILGELAHNGSTGSTCTFDVERGGQDEVGMESSDDCIISSARCLATQMGGRDGGGGGMGGISISSSARCSENGCSGGEGTPAVPET